MNCLDVRRILAATPTSRELDVLQHIEQCSGCARYAKREKLLSKQIARRLNVAVPDGLSFRIMLQHGLAEEKRYRLQRHFWQALAVGLIMSMLIVNNYPSSLEDVALAHVRNDPMALQVDDNVQLSTLNDLLAPYHLKLRQAIGRVDFAMPCRIRQYAGAHLVIQGKYGKVTVFIMPGEYVMARRTMQDRNLHGLLFPIDSGSIAIIGQVQEPLETIEARISQALISTTGADT